MQLRMWVPTGRECRQRLDLLLLKAKETLKTSVSGGDSEAPRNMATI